LPLFEYVFPLGSRARPRDAQLDLGAYEFRAPAFNSIKRDGQECDLAFTAEAGTEYDLQYTSDPASKVWLPAATHIASNGGTVQIADTNLDDQLQRFYRLKSSP
jgi:hypothetical protein